MSLWLNLVNCTLSSLWVFWWAAVWKKHSLLPCVNSCMSSMYAFVMFHRIIRHIIIKYECFVPHKTGVQYFWNNIDSNSKTTTLLILRIHFLMKKSHNWATSVVLTQFTASYWKMIQLNVVKVTQIQTYVVTLISIPSLLSDICVCGLYLVADIYTP